MICKMHFDLAIDRTQTEFPILKHGWQERWAARPEPVEREPKPEAQIAFIRPPT